MTNCGICDTQDVGFAWTDTHGVAQCTTCGSPYRLFHYDDQHNRIEKPPTLAVLDKFIGPLRQYWSETHSHIPSGCSFPGGYEIATQEEMTRFYEWANVHIPRDSGPETHDGDEVSR